MTRVLRGVSTTVEWGSKMRAKSFQFVLVAVILTPALVSAATQHQTHLNKDHVDPLSALKEAVTLLSPAAAKTAVTPQNWTSSKPLPMATPASSMRTTWSSQLRA